MTPSDPQELPPQASSIDAPKGASKSACDEPLLFERISLEKVWGGRALEDCLGLELGIDGPVGETWELSDRTEHGSVVRGGPHAGRMLHELLGEFRAELLGETALNEDDRFPLLVKYLSASKPLSVQVHPDDRTARSLHAGDCGKDEAWYILAAEPDSLIYLGLQPGIDANSFAAVAAGDGVVDLLQPWPVRAGQFVNVPAGTLHAIGEGISLVEVQQSSDVTYRLYDWGRAGLDGAPRETHVDQALLAIDYLTPVEGPIDPVFSEESGARRANAVVDSNSFELSLLELSGHIDSDTQERALIYIVVEGALKLEVSSRAAEGRESCWEFSSGDTLLVPATLGAHRLEATADSTKLIVVMTKT